MVKNESALTSHSKIKVSFMRDIHFWQLNRCSTGVGCQGVYKTGCQLRVLPNPFSTRMQPFDDFYNLKWTLLFLSATLSITSAPKHFQQQMSDILDEIPGVLCMMDDILIFGKTQDEHDTCLKKVLKKLN